MAGSMATNPAEVDSIMTRELVRICDGNVEGGGAELDSHAERSIPKHQAVLFQAPEFDLCMSNGEDFIFVSTHGNYTSGGLDGWGPRDWSFLALAAFNILSLLLNTVESGHPWPSGVLHGKVALLTKHPSKPAHTVGDYRALLILALLYRKWAAVRLYRLCL